MMMMMIELLLYFLLVFGQGQFSQDGCSIIIDWRMGVIHLLKSTESDRFASLSL
ncbi:hypothetical protein GLOIN_2v1533398, partial [Rhizophagus irregularis DAOM 181602=DAOM 197198]